MQETGNYKLKKPEGTDIVNIEDLNANTDIIDRELANKAQKEHTHSSYVNQNAFSNVKVGSTTIAADSTTDILTLAAGNNVTLTPDAANDKITISSANTVYTHPTTSGNKHIPSGGSSGQVLKWSADGTAAWGVEKDTVYTHPTHPSKTSGLYKVTIDGTGHVSATSAVTKADITNLGIPAQDTNTTYGVATTGALGLIKSGTDITVDSSGNVSVVDDSHNHVISNVDGLQSALDAKASTSHTHSNYVNQNAFSNVKVGATTIAADSTTDILTLEAGSNVTLTPDATNDKVTISATNTVYTHPTYTSKANGLYKVTIDGTGHISGTNAVTKADIMNLGIAPISSPVFANAISMGRTQGTTVGANSVAIGDNVEASGQYSYAEGAATKALSYASHAEGSGTEASGTSSHAEGDGTKATSIRGDHAEGYFTTASGGASHAEGSNTKASGISSHAEGGGTIASGDASHTEGTGTIAYGDTSHAEGYRTVAGEIDGVITAAHAEGSETRAIGWFSHAEGRKTASSGKNSHAEGYGTSTIGEGAHAEGEEGVAYGKYSHVEGGISNYGIGKGSPKAYGIGAHAEGGSTIAGSSEENDYESFAHAEGILTEAIGLASHAEGIYTIASEKASHAEGISTKAKGKNSHAEGDWSEAIGENSHAEGYQTTASNYASHVGGKLNKAMISGGAYNNKTGDAFVIGNGTSDKALSNAFRVTYGGSVYGLSAFQSSGADYAEYFEWVDGNPDNEDRVGYFVTMEGTKIKKAQSKQDYILGIVSAQPCIIGNSDEDWLGRWQHDEFGRFLTQEVKTPVTKWEKVQINNNISEESPKYTFQKVETEEYNIGWDYVPNPDYNPYQVYIERKDRKEWSAIGMMGVLTVRDDGSCKVNEFCSVKEGGIATAINDKNGYRVIERVTQNIVKVIFR